MFREPSPDNGPVLKRRQRRERRERRERRDVVGKHRLTFPAFTAPGVDGAPMVGFINL